MRVFLILVWLRLDHILLQIWLFFFPSFSFFVAVSEGGGGGVRGGRREGGGVRGGGGEGRRGREKGAEGEKLRKGSSPLFVLFHMFFARFPFRSSSLTKIY